MRFPTWESALSEHTQFKAFADRVRRIRKVKPPPDVMHRERERVYDVVAKRATPMWISADVTKIIRVSAEKMMAEVPDWFIKDQPLDKVLGKDMGRIEVEFPKVHTNRPRVGFCLFEEQISGFGDPALAGMIWCNGADFLPMYIVSELDRVSIELGMQPWSPVMGGARVAPAIVDKGSELAFLVSFFYSLGEFCDQEILTTSKRVRPPRYYRRQMAKLKEPVSDVVVVTLRRQHQNKKRGPGESDFEYSHRFLVDTHWRMQWYPSLGRHIPILIQSYVKGPEDKPLIIKERVVNVAR